MEATCCAIDMENRTWSKITHKCCRCYSRITYLYRHLVHVLWLCFDLKSSTSVLSLFSFSMFWCIHASISMRQLSMRVNASVLMMASLSFKDRYSCVSQYPDPETSKCRCSLWIMPSLLNGTFGRQTEMVRGSSLTQSDALCRHLQLSPIFLR